MKKILVLTAALMVSILSSCNSQNSVTVNGEKMKLKDGVYANIHTAKGDILLRLNHERTPMTVGNFVGLAEGKIKNTAKAEGVAFYDSLKFHRVIPNFMIQGGDPQGTGGGNPGYRFPDEFDPSLKHDSAGVLSMANSGPGTNGSQFFITHSPQPHLNGDHTVFGKVVVGQDVVNKIANNDLMEKVEIIRVGDAAMAFDGAAAFEEGKKTAGARELEARKKKEAAQAESAKAGLARVEELKVGAQSTDSGLFYKVISKGNGVKPEIGQTVAVAYAGYFADGTLFDSSIKEIAQKNNKFDPKRVYAPYDVVYGPQGLVIRGWQEGLTLMSVGDKYQLIIPPHLGYGPNGRPGIPGNSWLIFDVEIVSVK